MFLAESLFGFSACFWFLLVVHSSHHSVHLFHDSILPAQGPVAERTIRLGDIQCPALWRIFRV
jgi:hypothetical protein